ncbi:hypothetical protein AAE478_001515 [Parahypoxylon ruwenzoriense]
MAQRTVPSVRFSDETAVRTFESSHPQRRKKTLNTTTTLEIARFKCEEVTEHMLVKASQFFNENYGVWGQPPPDRCSFGKPGDRVKMSASRLRAQGLPGESRSSYLVVHRDYREQRLATTLLLTLLDSEDGIFGIVSSQSSGLQGPRKSLWKCGVDSNFFVDHTEPLEALAWLKEAGEWPLGDLPDGHEFLALFDVPRRRRSRSAQRASQERCQIQIT